MLFDDQITEACNKAYSQLHRINQFKKCLCFKTLNAVVYTFTFCTLNYCNILYYKLPKQSIHKILKAQNYAAKIVTNAKNDHITWPALSSH